MWHDQGKWVTCRGFSILSFQYNLLAHIKSYMLIHTPLQSGIWFKRYEQFFEFRNNVKHRNISSFLVCNSESILATSDSSPWSCHILSRRHITEFKNTKSDPHFCTKSTQTYSVMNFWGSDVRSRFGCVHPLQFSLSKNGASMQKVASST